MCGIQTSSPLAVGELSNALHQSHQSMLSWAAADAGAAAAATSSGCTELTNMSIGLFWTSLPSRPSVRVRCHLQSLSHGNLTTPGNRGGLQCVL